MAGCCTLSCGASRPGGCDYRRWYPLWQGGDALRVQQAIGYYLDQTDVVLAADASLADHLPPQESMGTAWGVIWHQGPLADRERLDDTVIFTDFTDLTVLELRQPSAEVRKNAAGILEVMLRLKPLAESHTDLHLALVQLLHEDGAAQTGAADTWKPQSPTCPAMIRGLPASSPRARWPIHLRKRRLAARCR